MTITNADSILSIFVIISDISIIPAIELSTVIYILLSFY